MRRDDLIRIRHMVESARAMFSDFPGGRAEHIK
jgi:hypothetical protein